MIKKSNCINLSYKDFIPALSGLIGKIALVSSFALVWAQELSITNPNFVLENVRMEILIASVITLIAAILYPKASPAGTLAPLVVLIPVMAGFGVHPLVLGILVGGIGILVVRAGIFKRLVELAGFTCKTSITLTFGLTGIWMSGNKLYSFLGKEKHIFVVLVGTLILVYIYLLYYKKNWLMIPVASLIAMVIPYLFGAGYELVSTQIDLNLSPYYWWNEMWGIGFGFDLVTILKTIPFALFVILLWTIDTISIQTIRQANYGPEEENEDMNTTQSFLIVSIRNIVGAFFGGAQTASLWRSFLIPLYMVKRPMQSGAILLGLVGIITSLTVVSIQIMSYTPMVWSVLLFGIFMPFTVTAITNMMKEKKKKTNLFILLCSALGVGISPVLTWIISIIYDRYNKV